MINRKNIIKFLLLLTLHCLVTACLPEQCLDADDFGFPKIDVPAWYPENEIVDNQVQEYVKWKDSDLVLNGDPFYAVVEYWDRDSYLNNQNQLSAWCPFYGPSDKPPSLKDICIFFPECKIQKMCEPSKDELSITNAPCLMKRGVGLYVAIGGENFNPNKTIESNLNPLIDDSKAIVRHMGYNLLDSVMNNESRPEAQETEIINNRSAQTVIETPSSVSMKNDAIETSRFTSLKFHPRRSSSEYVLTGGIYADFDEDLARHMKNGKAYFKIVDRIYSDNSGQYTVKFKSGVNKKTSDPFQFIIKGVKDMLFGANGIVIQFFKSLVAESNFIFSIKIFVIFYVSINAINFLIGNINITINDLMVRYIKIIIILQLVSSPNAWQFFNDNLFFLFLDGMDFVIDILREAGNTGSGPSSIIAFMLSPHSLVKLISLLGVSFAGFIYAILFIVGYFITIALIFYAMIFATSLHVTALIMMGVLISLSPIFISLTMFEFTKSLFEEWLKKLISFTIQPIIIVAGITIVTAIIKHNIYATLGYKVCKNHFISTYKTASTGGAEGTSVGNAFGMYVWRPVFAKNETLTNIPAPEAFNKCGDRMCLIGNTVYSRTDLSTDSNYTKISNTNNLYDYKGPTNFCRSYQCYANRYPSFPYIDPGNPVDMKIYDDLTGGKFISITGIIIMVLVAYLLMLFCETVSSIADYLTNSSGNAPGLSEIASKSAGEMTRLAKATFKPVAKVVARTSGKLLYETSGAGRLKRHIQNKLSDKLRFVPKAKDPKGFVANLGVGVNKTATKTMSFLSKNILIRKSSVSGRLLRAWKKDKAAKNIFKREKAKKGVVKRVSSLVGNILLLPVLVPLKTPGKLQKLSNNIYTRFAYEATGIGAIKRSVHNKLAKKFPKRFKFVGEGYDKASEAGIYVNKLLRDTYFRRFKFLARIGKNKRSFEISYKERRVFEKRESEILAKMKREFLTKEQKTRLTSDDKRQVKRQAKEAFMRECHLGVDNIVESKLEKNKFSKYYINEYQKSKLQYLNLTDKIESVERAFKEKDKTFKKSFVKHDKRMKVFELSWSSKLKRGLSPEEKLYYDEEKKSLNIQRTKLEDSYKEFIKEKYQQLLVPKAEARKALRRLAKARGELKKRGINEKEYNIPSEKNVELLSSSSKKIIDLQTEYIQQIKKIALNPSDAESIAEIDRIEAELRKEGIDESEISKFREYHEMDAKIKGGIEKTHFDKEKDKIKKEFKHWITDSKSEVRSKFESSVGYAFERIKLNMRYRLQYYWEENLKRRTKMHEMFRTYMKDNIVGDAGVAWFVANNMIAKPAKVAMKLEKRIIKKVGGKLLLPLTPITQPIKEYVGMPLANKIFIPAYNNAINPILDPTRKFAKSARDYSAVKLNSAKRYLGKKLNKII